jgi:hypothetical protein
MKTIVYDIYDFKWYKSENTFRANANTLYDISTNHYYQLAFPNERSKFNIKNNKTNGFRRFLYVKEISISNDEIIWIFKSEDGIRCEITKINN